MSKYALFDFDGTLTRLDTTRDLIAVLARFRPLRFLTAIPLLVAMVAARSHPDLLQARKCAVLGHLYAGLEHEDLTPFHASFARRVRPLFRSEVMDSILLHQEQGTQVVIVSASPAVAIEAALGDPMIAVIGTRFALSHNRISGAVIDGACFGEAKVAAIQRWLDGRPGSAEIVEAWSDSWSDAPMMRLAKIRVWIGDTARCRKFQQDDPEGRVLVLD